MDRDIIVWRIEYIWGWILFLFRHPWRWLKCWLPSHGPHSVNLEDVKQEPLLVVDNPEVLERLFAKEN